MENDNFEKVEIFDTPEQLAASMQADAQQSTEEAPQQESQPVSEQPVQEQPEQVEQVDNVQPEPQEEVQEERQYQATTDDFVDNQESTENNIQQYSDQEIENAVFNYVSERLGREVKSFDDFSQPESTLDERVQKIAEFVKNTGRDPQDWFRYQSLNPSEMDDITAIRVQYSQNYPDLNFNEINTLISSKYKLNADEHSDEEVKISTLQLKIDAADARNKITEIRDTYAAPVQSTPSTETEESYFDESWMQEMIRETSDFEGLEFDLGNGKTFNFGVGDNYKNNLVNRHQKIEDYFDRYVDSDGNWDHDTFNSHQTLIDNIDNIVASAYRQGLGDGQRGLVDRAANVSTATPTATPASNDVNSLAEQVKNIMGATSNKMTFKI
tara:strand:+ start:1581 stop:2729 length:1149 start_codon:yes stop_codon:yes gene_type:complete